jgi:Ser/Thr protein kinase RdoA (MazF antagonist)
VLVTELVDGDRAAGRGRTFGVLGALLGALHARTVEARTPMRRGGAWHHIAPEGGPREEVEAVVALLDALRGRVTSGEAGQLGALREAVRAIDDCEDLPAALLHPDFVPANAISRADGGLVMVDWTGTGRGPRLWSLGFLLWAAGARDLRLVDAVVTQYRRRVRPEPGELARLASAIGARPLIFACWNVGAGRRGLAEVAGEIEPTARLAATIAARARAGFEETAGKDDPGEKPRGDGARDHGASPG